MAKRKSTARPSDTYPGAYDLYSASGQFVAFIDSEDVESAIQYRWRRNTSYTMRTFNLPTGKQTTDLLQRLVARNLGYDLAEMNVRFRSGDSRDCRRENLLVVTRKNSKFRASD